MRDRCRPFYASLLILTLWIAAAPRALALLTFNDGKDQVFVNASYTFGFDSNVFTQQVAHSSATETASLSLSYARKAGLISVNASVGWSIGEFSQFQSDDFTNPSYSVSFTKGTGRTTGSLSFNAQKTDVPDPDANNRAVAWNYGSALDLRYPINERYYITNGTDISGIFYTDKGLFTDLDTYSDALDINYVYDSKLDLTGGYRFRLSDTDNTTNYDNSVTIGADGSILPKLSGSITAGYEKRSSAYLGTHSGYGDVTAASSLNWRYSKLLSFSGSVDKDYGTTSTDISTDTTSISLNTDMSLARNLRTSVDASYTLTDFLGLLGAGRQDTLWQFTANLGTAITTHIRTNLAYTYMINYSNTAGASFTRQTLSLNITASY